MRKLILVAMLASSNAMAIDFTTEWAKFADDFAKLRAKTNIKVDVDVPKAGNVQLFPLKEEEPIEMKQVDPKSPDRLGLKLQDPAMRERVTKLYQNPNTVVYSATIR